MNPKKAIPLQTLALVATTACGPDPFIGDWAGTNFTYTTGDGAYVNDIDLPYTYTYSYGGVDYTYSIDLSFRVDDEGNGSMIFEQTYGDGTDYTYANPFIGTRNAKGDWSLVFTDYYSLELNCIADKVSLVCNGVDEDDGIYDITAVKSE